MPTHEPAQHQPQPTPQDGAFAELEKVIGGLPLREPSMMLDARIQASLADEGVRCAAVAPRSTRSKVMRFAAIAALALIAGGVVVGLILSGPQPDGGSVPGGVADRSDASPNTAAQIVDAGYRFDPDPIRLEWTRDLGEQVRTTPSGKPYRAIVRESVQTRTWYDATNGVTIQVSRPREELIIAHQPVF